MKLETFRIYMASCRSYGWVPSWAGLKAFWREVGLGLREKWRPRFAVGYFAVGYSAVGRSGKEG